MEPLRSEIADGMRIDWDVAVPMDDGIVLRADVFRPIAQGRYPVILSMGPFGKGLAFQEGNTSAWERMITLFPEVAEGSTNKYQSWEVVDPEKWVPDGYVVIRVDSRGAGRSPGFMDCWSPRETRDLYHCIEWAAVQPWSTGKVGLNGISYFAMNQWWVAALAPPHLTAICVWEGAADYYREVMRHGGIYSQFFDNLYPRAFLRVQHGLGERGLRSRVHGDLVSGPVTLTDEELARNRLDIEAWSLAHPFDDAAHRERSAQWDKVKVPFLSAANWGGQGLHTRGNFEGYLAAASTEKWLEVHGHAHWVHFYTIYGVGLQKRFFGHFLKGEDTGWSRQSKVQLLIRHPGERFVERHENEWPLARTEWTSYYLEPGGMALTTTPPGGSRLLEFDAMGRGLQFLTPPMTEPLEITGPIAARLTVSSTTTDADLFLTLRLLAPDGTEVTWHGSNDPKTPLAIGWLRASHRKLEPERSLPDRPWHTHDAAQPLTPGAPVDLDIEIWPTCIVVPPGYRLALWVRGRDYEGDNPVGSIAGVKYTLTGVGPFLHEHPQDRPPAIFAGRTTLHFAPGRQPHLLLPIIPDKAGA